LLNIKRVVCHTITANKACGTNEATISFGLISKPKNPHPKIGKKTSKTTNHRAKASQSAFKNFFS